MYTGFIWHSYIVYITYSQSSFLLTSLCHPEPISFQQYHEKSTMCSKDRPDYNRITRESKGEGEGEGRGKAQLCDQAPGRPCFGSKITQKMADYSDKSAYGAIIIYFLFTVSSANTHFHSDWTRQLNQIQITYCTVQHRE